MHTNPRFSTYRLGENCVTASLLAVLERLGITATELLLRAAMLDDSLKLLSFVNQPGAGASAAHGTWYAVAPFSFTQQELLPTAPHAPQMNPEARLWFLHTAAKMMLEAPEGAHLVIEVQGHPCEYAIIDHQPGHGLGLQIGCREWDCPYCGNQPLSDNANAQLGSLGFRPAAPQLNAWRQSVPHDSRELAILVESAFLGAYEPELDFEIALYAGTVDDYSRLIAELT